MEYLWLGVLGLVGLALVRRHGWEYVPLLLLIGVGRWYAANHGLAELAHGSGVMALGAVWFTAKLTGDRH